MPLLIAALGTALGDVLVCHLQLGGHPEDPGVGAADPGLLQHPGLLYRLPLLTVVGDPIPQCTFCLVGAELFHGTNLLVWARTA